MENNEDLQDHLNTVDSIQDPTVSPRAIPLWTLKAYNFLGTAAWACLFRLIGVYYNYIGLTGEQVGYITFWRKCFNFFGALFWGRICDYLGDYKRVLLGCSVVSTALNMCLTLSFVQSRFVFVFSLICCGAFVGGGASASIIDALCNTVLRDSGDKETYGNQRLWAALAAALVCASVGKLVDLYGIIIMFGGFSMFTLLSILIMCRYLPNSMGTRETRNAQRQGFAMRNWLRFEVLWFFANLLIYGICMSLVETFLFIYVLRDFQNAPKFLVGLMVTLMCGFEVPVFKYFHVVAGGPSPLMSLKTVLSVCHIILAVRCILYAAIPAQHPWLVLFIEPLHGITFAAMWAASVTYGKILARPGEETLMQVFINGFYYQLANGFGSLIWGSLSDISAYNMDFRHCFALDGFLTLLWSLIWGSGWFFWSWRSTAGQRVNSRVTSELP